ncbi:MAG: DegV family protein [Actinomycetes bacterium]
MSRSMAGRVAVVTDSTAYLPTELAARYDIRVVPLQVSIGERTGDEGTEVTPDDVAQALLVRRTQVRTSRPAPARFAQEYADAQSAGADAVVVVTMSAALSGTFEAATGGCDGATCEVQCVDSRTTAMGLGFAVLAAARCAADGASTAAVASAAHEAAAATRTLFYVDTLEHLRRGGRIGRARALVGTALSVKPILHIEGGEIALLDKVRTASRARARLVDLAVEAAGDRHVDVAVHHAASEDLPDAVVGELRARVPKLRDLVVSQLGAAITAHTGPGVVGVVVSPA